MSASPFRRCSFAMSTCDADAWRMAVELHPSLATYTTIWGMSTTISQDYTPQVARKRYLPSPLRSFAAQQLAHVLLAQESGCRRGAAISISEGACTTRSLFGLQMRSLRAESPKRRRGTDEAKKQPDYSRSSACAARRCPLHATISITLSSRSRLRWEAAKPATPMHVMRPKRHDRFLTARADRACDSSARVLSETFCRGAARCKLRSDRADAKAATWLRVWADRPGTEGLDVREAKWFA